MEKHIYKLTPEQLDTLNFTLTPEQLEGLHPGQNHALASKFHDMDCVPAGLIQESLEQHNGLESTVVGAGLELKKSCIPVEGVGMGLFAARGFFKNAVITEYCGPLVGYEEAKSLPDHETTHHKAVLKHCLVIDGLKDPWTAFGQGGGSFINDPINPKLYNCKAKVNETTNRLYIIATRDIAPGEEVFFSYGKLYWKERKGSMWEIDPNQVPGRVRSLKDLNRTSKGGFRKGKKVLVRKPDRNEGGEWKAAPRKRSKVLK
jgi:SET domain